MLEIPDADRREHVMSHRQINSCPDAIFKAAVASFRHIYSRLAKQPPSFLRPRFGAEHARQQAWTHRDRFFEQFDYERHADEFNHAFFLKNVFKALLAISIFRASYGLDDTDVVDVGSGAGSLSVAWNEVYRARSGRLSLFDTSEAQLRSAKTVLESLQVPSYELRCEDFLSVGAQVPGTRLAGYWACSQRDRDSQALAASLQAGICLLIDYRHVLDFVGNLLAPACDRIDLRLHRIPLPVNNPRLFSDEEINVSASLFVPKEH